MDIEIPTVPSTGESAMAHIEFAAPPAVVRAGPTVPHNVPQPTVPGSADSGAIEPSRLGTLASDAALRREVGNPTVGNMTRPPAVPVVDALDLRAGQWPAE